MMAAGVTANTFHPESGSDHQDHPTRQGLVDLDPEITGVFCRSQSVKPGGLFVAVQGFSADGHDYITQAVSRGAVAVVSQRPVQAQAVIHQVPDTRKALADIAAAYYRHPSRRMTVIGITGTNGKTTTSYLIESILTAAGATVGVIGTINYRYGGLSFDNPVTTPESLDLQAILAQMHQAGVTHVVLEVSSHALELQRVRNCNIDIGVFTNLSQDHLDFHKDMAAYWASKQKLFTEILPAATNDRPSRAVINCHDPKGKELAETLALPVLSTGMTAAEDIWAQDPVFNLSGITTTVHSPRGEIAVLSSLAGRHNLENILNAMGVGLALDIPLPTIRTGIAALRNVPGRLERVDNKHERFVYVDYAHTPDALENVLRALRDLTTDRIICVFGCGGDRDRGKRPMMGRIATSLSDVAVVTSDNPRTESPQAIIDEILTGVVQGPQRLMAVAQFLSADNRTGHVIEPDRRKAIQISIRGSRPGDTILIAGKGHEDYQIIGDRKYPFDDREEAGKALQALGTI